MLHNATTREQFGNILSNSTGDLCVTGHSQRPCSNKLLNQRTAKMMTLNQLGRRRKYESPWEARGKHHTMLHTSCIVRQLRQKVLCCCVDCIYYDTGHQSAWFSHTHGTD